MREIPKGAFPEVQKEEFRAIQREEFPEIQKGAFQGNYCPQLRQLSLEKNKVKPKKNI
jgi:hypothetical protein